jgi:RimJ/RimL family protein N-acetyltransferase
MLGHRLSAVPTQRPVWNATTHPTNLVAVSHSPLTGLCIETPRLLLRLPLGSDATPLLEIHEHPEAIKYVTTTRRGIVGAWTSVAMMLGHWQLRGYGQWTISEKATGEVVGRVGFWYPEGWPGAELGWIIRHSRWGNGFATEASKASLEWAWTNTDLPEVISLIEPSNIASIRVAEKIGERFLRREIVNGEDLLVYGISRS